MDQDFPWWLVAFVIIGFLRWLINKIQGGDKEENLSQMEEMFLEQEEEAQKQAQREEVARRQRGEAPSKGMPPPALARGRDQPEDEIRKFFEALGGGVAEAPPPIVREVRRAPSPPPVPARPPVPKAKRPPSPAAPDAYAIKPVAERLSAQERTALLHVRERSGGATPYGAAAVAPVSAIRALLRSSGGLRSAVLLKEILDQPKGLKDSVESHSF